MSTLWRFGNLRPAFGKRVVTGMLLSLPLLLWTACAPLKMDIEMLEQRTLPGVPSASGLAWRGDSLWIVGDNSAWLFLVNTSGDRLAEFPAMKNAFSQDSILKKKKKPDFEALEWIDSDDERLLVAIGSGSLRPSRDIATVFRKEGQEAHLYDIGPLYDRLRDHPRMTGHELNLEGLACLDDRLWLLNRSNNLIFQFDTKAFLDHLEKGGPVPAMTTSQLDLPEILTIKAGLSGSVASDTGELLFFSASVENNGHAIDDGDILGSFVGIIPASKLKNKRRPIRPVIYPLKRDGQYIQVKVEGISVRWTTPGKKGLLYLVTDSDGGPSELITLGFEVRGERRGE